MKTIQINLFSFSELTEDAKQTAIDQYRKDIEHDFIISEAHQTFQEFIDIFSIDYRQIDYCEMYRSQWSHNLESYILELSGLRLRTYIMNNFYDSITSRKYYGHLESKKEIHHPCIRSKKNSRFPGDYINAYLSRINREYDNCPLTGVCYDCSILKPIYEFIKKPNQKIDFRELLDDCIYSFAKDVCSEIEYRESDEGISEYLNDSDYKYTKDGKEWHY